MQQFSKAFLFFFSICLFNYSEAQLPTTQDCLGAIPLCSSYYNTANAYYGMGNYPYEHPPISCTWAGESNSVWFTFTIQQSGNLAFTLTPNTAGYADYDWFLYNLTNASCADVPTNSSLMVSCNASQWGVTGISSFGVGNWNGPGFTNAFNYLYPVTTGQTYALNISNWAGSSGGFHIDFGASTAVLYDTIKPELQSIQSVTCNATTLHFAFTENVECASVQDADFALTGPGGVYALSGVTSPVCTVGGTYTDSYSITVSPAITTGGTYVFSLVGPVNDLCGNISLPDTLHLIVYAATANIDSVHAPICAGSNGEIFASASNGVGPYSFTLNGGPSQPSGTFSGLNGGFYIVSVTDGNGCVDTVHVSLPAAAGNVNLSVSASQDPLCNASCDGWINTSISGGLAPYNYVWTNGAGTNSSAVSLCANNYQVTVTDAAGCMDSVAVTLVDPPPINFSVAQQTNVSCSGYTDGSVEVNVSGGTPGYSYQWSPSGGTDSIAGNLAAGNYTLSVTDAHNCFYNYPVTITQPLPLLISAFTDTDICDGTPATLYANVSGGTQPYAVNWDNGAFGGNPYIVQPGVDQTYVAVATDANNCISNTEDYPVHVVYIPVFDIGNDTLICNGDAFTRSAFFSGATYQWNDGLLTPSRSFTKMGLYYVDVSNMCATVRDSLNVEVYDCESCVHAPNAFTPNGDGINDIFLPAYTCSINQFMMRIYTRWGAMIFETNSPDVGWNGLSQGVPAEVGTYVWYLQYEGTNKKGLPVSETQKGNVILLR